MALPLFLRKDHKNRGRIVYVMRMAFVFPRAKIQSEAIARTRGPEKPWPQSDFDVRRLLFYRPRVKSAGQYYAPSASAHPIYGPCPSIHYHFRGVSKKDLGFSQNQIKESGKEAQRPARFDSLEYVNSRISR